MSQSFSRVRLHHAHVLVGRRMSAIPGKVMWFVGDVVHDVVVPLMAMCALFINLFMD
jgi:hypothetical protein